MTDQPLDRRAPDSRLERLLERPPATAPYRDPRRPIDERIADTSSADPPLVADVELTGERSEVRDRRRYVSPSWAR